MAKDLPRRRTRQNFKPGFAGRLVRARLAEGKTQAAMAEEIGIGYRLYQRIEIGERTPEPSDLKLMAAYFGWDMTELLVECNYIDAPSPSEEEVPEVPEVPEALVSGDSPAEQIFCTKIGPIKVEVIIRVSRA